MPVAVSVQSLWAHVVAEAVRFKSNLTHWVTEVDPGGSRGQWYRVLRLKTGDLCLDKDCSQAAFERIRGPGIGCASHPDDSLPARPSAQVGRNDQVLWRDQAPAKRRIRDRQGLTQRENESAIQHCAQW
jgi:hypothetical protein